MFKCVDIYYKSKSNLDRLYTKKEIRDKLGVLKEEDIDKIRVFTGIEKKETKGIDFTTVEHKWIYKDYEVACISVLRDLIERKKGTLIVIDGTDGSGKKTQTDELFERLKSEGKKVLKVDFPDYESDSSALVKMYLRGAFGKDANSVDPYVASTFYAVDRYASFKTKWEEFYNDGYIILADRYTTSNMVHQASKLGGVEKDKYLDWLYDFEYNMYKIPKPDCVIYLDVPTDYTLKMMEGRSLKNGQDTDIHEGNAEFLRKSRENAQYIVKKYGWENIDCVREGRMRCIEDINMEIYGKVLDVIN